MPHNLNTAGQPSSHAGAGDAPVRVLIAEDQEFIRKGLLMAFRRAGYHCSEAADGREAREKITSAQDAFHLLVTDHEMPHSSGLELVEVLRQQSPDTQVIVFSGSLTDKLTRGYRELGVNHIIAKPASFHDLLEAATTLRGQSQDH